MVAIGAHQTISEDDIKSELAKSKIKINQVQRLKFNGQPTRKVVVEFDNEQDMKIALFNGIYFGRIRVRCESYRTTPPVTQCYKCQGFNHIDKDCKNQKCVKDQIKIQADKAKVRQEKLQNNLVELDNIVHKLETKMEESFKALGEKVVSFMVNSMLEIYDKSDRKNTDI